MDFAAIDGTRRRLLNAAVSLFAANGFDGVSIVDVAKVAEVTSQAVYRYFRNKKELFAESIAYDLEALNLEVLKTLENIPMPMLTGGIWYSYAALLPGHPLARQALAKRSPEYFDIFNALPSRKTILNQMVAEFQMAQKAGALRQDIDVEETVDSLKEILIYVMYPLIAEDKYGTQEWLRATNIILATLFYPAPDATSPDSLKAFGESFAKLTADHLGNSIPSDSK